MEGDLYWLVYWDGHKHHVAPHRAETRQLATRHGMEHVLDRELVAVFSDDVTLTLDEMLDLAPVLPRPGSPIWRPE
jgi:hypothetical protein